MTDPVIQVEKLSKRYRIGENSARYGSLRESLASALRLPFKKSLKSKKADRRFETIWALNEVSFDIRQGEVVGIIGRNGAGKSTLLKILSRITRPTLGKAIVRGRVGSLLEVGTGFHPELTGMENIYLSGAVLGMKRIEIEEKFQEIVEFAEIQQFIDTPVKHFSSGMYMRLAFSVAAHLDPEILLIDEVLAVGDSAFQRKCLGRMDDVAKEGRTVLFVSHNLGAVQHLCPRSLLLDSGKIISDSNTKKVIEDYLGSVEGLGISDLSERTDRRGKGQIRFVKIDLLDANSRPIEHAISGQRLTIRLRYVATDQVEFRNCRASVSIHSIDKIYFLASTELVMEEELILKGDGYLECIIEELPLSKGAYYLNPFVESNGVIQDWVDRAVRILVEDGDFYGTGKNYPPGWEGKTVLVKHDWKFHCF